MPSVGESEPKDADQAAPTRKCAGCEKPAGSLQCPKCLALNVPDSYFCDQDCFKTNWVPLSHEYH
jgi:zf-MYND-like zinc finger, mRNA-binding